MTDLTTACGASVTLRLYDKFLRQIMVGGSAGRICDPGDRPPRVLHPGEEITAAVIWRPSVYDARLSDFRPLPGDQSFLATYVFWDGNLEIQSNVVAL